MTAPAATRVIVVGRLPERLAIAVDVLRSHGFAPTGVHTEQDAQLALAEGGRVLAVVAGGGVPEEARERLNQTTAEAGAAFFGVSIGQHDPRQYFEEQVLPLLVAARDHN